MKHDGKQRGGIKFNGENKQGPRAASGRKQNESEGSKNAVGGKMRHKNGKERRTAIAENVKGSSRAVQQRKRGGALYEKTPVKARK